MRIDPNRFKQIVVSRDNYLWLRSLGQTSDSFNDVITGLRQASTSKNNLEGPKVPTPLAQPVTPTPTTPTTTVSDASSMMSTVHDDEGQQEVIDVNEE